MTGLIAKRYKVDSLLQNSGSVYHALDVQLERTVALKMVPAERAPEAFVFARFFREATAAARLSHPTLVRVYDVVEQDGRPQVKKAAARDPVMVMEYLPGNNLDFFMGHGEALPSEEDTDPLERRIDLVLEICRGLQHGHEQGLVHGCLTPFNVMVTPSGEARILNFGITPVTGQPASQFVAPEQRAGQAGIDPRSDIFSLGRILYELLILDQPSNKRPDALRPLEAGLPGWSPALVGVLRQSLAHDPADRFPDGRAMERALREARSSPIALQDVSTSPFPVQSSHPVADPRRRHAESVLREAREAQAGGQLPVASLLAFQALQIDPTLHEAGRVFEQTQQILKGKRTERPPEGDEPRPEAGDPDRLAVSLRHEFVPANAIPAISAFEPVAETGELLSESPPAPTGTAPGGTGAYRSFLRSRLPRLLIPTLAVLLLVAGIWYATSRRDGGPAPVAAREVKPAPVAPASESGTVALDIVPWSKVESIVRVKDGKTIQLGELVTPCVFSLPAGRYMVNVSHPDFGSRQFAIDVKGGEILRFEYSLLSKQELERELNSAQ